AGRFARGDTIKEIARDLRVTEGSVRRWHRAWQDGGDQALRSRGPVSREKLGPQQWARLEAELRKGPLAHGFANDQRWTLGRIKTQIGRLFHIGYTPDGGWRVMRRRGWSCQVAVRQAPERDGGAVPAAEGRGWHERGEGRNLERVPGPDHRRPPRAVSPAGLDLQQPQHPPGAGAGGLRRAEQGLAADLPAPVVCA